jgi:hypothetical protein
MHGTGFKIVDFLFLASDESAVHLCALYNVYSISGVC